MLKVLVTGGAGFIGSHTVDKLLEEGYEVRIFDNLDPQVHGEEQRRPSWMPREAEFMFGDVRDYDGFKRAVEDVEIIIHAAAAVGVGQSMYEISPYISANVMGTANLWDILVNEKNKVEKVLIASSMSIYGEGAYRCAEHGLQYPKLRGEAQLKKREWRMLCPVCQQPVKPAPTKESKPLYCTSVYAQSKKDQEEYSLIIGQTYNTPTTACRFFNVYGTRQSLSNPYTGAAAIFLSRIKAGNPPLIYEDGEQLRDFISVHDIVKAELMLMKDSRADYHSYNIGAGQTTSIKQLAETLIELTAPNSGLEPEIVGKYRAGDIRDCYADITEISQLGFKPGVSLKEGLKELAEWSLNAESRDEVDNAHSELVKRGLVK